MTKLDPKDYRNGVRVTRSANGDLVTADPATGEPTAAPAPKVLAAAAVSGSLVVLVAILTAVTPDLLAFAGPWAPVLFAGVVALAGFLGGYIKRP